MSKYESGIKKKVKVKVELKKKGKREKVKEHMVCAHVMCTWYLQTMVVFNYGKVKSELNHDSQDLLTQLKM
jgi:hypothetical protein